MTNAAFQPSSAEPEFGYGQLFGTLLRRWPWVVGALGIAMAGAVYVSMREEPIFRSSMQLIVEPNFEQGLRESDITGIVSNNRINNADYATQLALMRSDQFLRDAVDLLQDEYPGLTVEDVKGSFTLTRVEENKDSTRIFAATYIDKDATKTQRFLEALQTVYLDYNEQQQANRLIEGLKHVNDQLAETRGHLQEAQGDLEGFRQQQNLIDPNIQAQAVTEALNRVQEEQRQLLADFNQVESRYAAVEQQLSLAPETALVASRLSQSDRVQTLLNTLQETNLALADRQIIFTDQDPTVQVLLEQRENQLAQLRNEVSSIIRQPVSDLDPDMMSWLQLGGVDLSLVSELLELDSTIQGLQARFDSVFDLEDSLKEELNRFPSLIAEYDQLRPTVDINRTTLEELLVQRERLSSELARGGFSWEIVEAPELGEQIGPDPVRPLALGMVAGLFVGGALAFARESMDRVVRTSDDLQRQVPLPLLGILPTQATRRRFGFASNGHSNVPPVLHPELADSDVMQIVMWPAFRESLDLIANNLQLLQQGHGAQVLAVTSALPGEGKTTITLGLAISLARMRQKVLVIDADLRQSGIQHELGLNSHNGLSQLLAGVSTSPNRPHRLDFGPASVDILPAGPPPEDPITLLSSPRLQRLVNRCKNLYDLVLVDTPPVLGMADALKVGAICDNVLLVSRLDGITQEQLNDAMTSLSRLRVLGIVANGARGQSVTYSEYGKNSYRPTAVPS